MSYGLLYKIPFATQKNRACVVEIEKENYEGVWEELTAAGTPFTVDIDDEEFLYTPLRFSTAKLNVVGKDYLQALFSTQYRQHRVTLTVDGVVTWCGYIKPEVYTQDYTSETFELELECMSAMSVLEYIDYTIQGEEKQFVSLWSLLKRCVEASRGRYTAVNVPFVYGMTKENYQAGENVLDRMMVSEQNFFDEDDQPMKLKEVLEEVCKFLGWTCTDWRGELWFVDMDHQGTYHKYDQTLTTKQDNTFNELTVQEVGFRGSDHSLDILPGYNKVIVRCSNYPLGEIGSMSIDLKDLNVLAYPNTTEVGNDVSKRLLIDPTKMGRNLKTIAYKYESGLKKITDYSPYKSGPLDGDSNRADALYGALPVRYCLYTMEEEGGLWKPSITSYSYTDALRINDDLEMKANDEAIASIRFSDILYPMGAICINATLCMFQGGILDFLNLKETPDGKMSLRYSLRIGSNYYNLSEHKWQDAKVINEVETDEYSDGWYRIKDEKTLQMPYEGASGHIVEVTSERRGELEILIYTPKGQIRSFGMKDFKIEFISMEGNDKDNSEDRTYENVLNAAYINELDEIELKISSYNEDGACYSKIVIDDAYLKDNLYNAILDKQMRPENMLISRIISHYSTTRMKLTEIINESPSLTPITRMSDNFLLGKKFMNAGGSIDFRNDQFSFTMIEI
mgnify:CR=1 FL=1|jgi:hypothetical protein